MGHNGHFCWPFRQRPASLSPPTAHLQCSRTQRRRWVGVGSERGKCDFTACRVIKPRQLCNQPGGTLCSSAAAATPLSQVEGEGWSDCAKRGLSVKAIKGSALLFYRWAVGRVGGRGGL